MRWSVLIPAKSLPEAKSRLARSAGDPRSHERLVQALRADTVAAAAAADGVARVIVVADRDGLLVPGAHEVLVQSAPGLNPALSEAAQLCAQRWPADGVAALLGDVPALLPEELADALRAAVASPLAFVADHEGSGTTLLTARPGIRLEPRFGAGSAARHARIATALSGGPGLRQDVDTDADLARAVELGVGPHTQAALGSRAAPGTSAVHLD